jgi:hypothetical protein
MRPLIYQKTQGNSREKEQPIEHNELAAKRRKKRRKSCIFAPFAILRGYCFGLVCSSVSICGSLSISWQDVVVVYDDPGRSRAGVADDVADGAGQKLARDLIIRAYIQEVATSRRIQVFGLERLAPRVNDELRQAQFQQGQRLLRYPFHHFIVLVSKSCACQVRRIYS